MENWRGLGEIQRKIPNFEGIMMRTSDPIDLFMAWHDNRRPHRLLDFEYLETPACAFARKMPPSGEIVMDEQTGEKYNVRQGGEVFFGLVNVFCVTQ